MTPWTASHQVLLSLGFSRQEHWSRLPFPSPMQEKVKSESAVTQSCLTLSDPMDCSLPGSSVHGIFRARVLEWGAIAFSESERQTLPIGKERGETLTHFLLQPELVPCWTPQPLLSLFPIVLGGFPDGSVVKDLPIRRCRFNPWVGKIPWRRKWQPTPVFLPGKSHGQKSLVGYSSWHTKELGTT